VRRRRRRRRRRIGAAGRMDEQEGMRRKDGRHASTPEGGQPEI